MSEWRDGRLVLPYEEALATVRRLAEEDPGAVYPRPAAIFDPETLAPQDPVALVLLAHGFDPRRIATEEGLRNANDKAWRVAWEAFFWNEESPFREPHFGTFALMSALAERTDRGAAWPLGRSARLAIAYAERTRKGWWRPEGW